MLKPTKSKKEMDKASKKTAKSVAKYSSAMEALGRATSKKKDKNNGR